MCLSTKETAEAYKLLPALATAVSLHEISALKGLPTKLVSEILA